MAYTKIHAIKATLPKAVKYITTDDKTDGKSLVTSFGCGIESAAYDFEYSLSKTSRSDPNKAFHLIQSFLPGEVSPEEAHKIGVELADKLLEGKYSYIVSTHIDRGHVHNHIIFCAADNIDHRKYNDCKESYRRIRKLSDELCREHVLSIISPSKEKGKSYKEWLADKENSSWKTALKKDIDEAVYNAQDYDDFCRFMRKKRYEIKGEGFGENDLKFISFRAPGYTRFVRGNERVLGVDYTKERIKERIENKDLAAERVKAVFPHKKKSVGQDYSGRRLIDTTDEKFTESPGLKRWADKQNLKIAAAAYTAAGSISELKEKISQKTKSAKETRQKLVDTERRIKEVGEALRYAEQYKENRIYHVRYEKSKDKDRYLRDHESQLILYDGAKNMLRKLGIRPSKDLNVDEIRADYEALCQKRDELRGEYKTAEKEVSKLSRDLEKLETYLDTSREQNQDKTDPDRKQKRGETSL